MKYDIDVQNPAMELTPSNNTYVLLHNICIATENWINYKVVTIRFLFNSDPCVIWAMFWCRHVTTHEIRSTKFLSTNNVL